MCFFVLPSWFILFENKEFSQKMDILNSIFFTGDSFLIYQWLGFYNMQFYQMLSKSESV